MIVKKYAKEIVILLISLGVAIVGYWTRQNYTYHDTKQPQQVLKTKEKTNDDVVLIFHKTGCPDCKQVVRQINQAIKQGQADEYVIVDTKDSNLYEKYNIIEVPTAIHLRDGKEIDRQAGINNLNKLEKVIHAAKE
ncbi:thioredoxin family protein [Weissella paramesenteroides]